MALRVKRVAESSKSDEQNAKKEIENYDSRRREFIKRYFHEALENPLDFDMVINTEFVNYEDAAVLITSALPFKNKPEVPEKR
jgi:cytidylate kinase